MASQTAARHDAPARTAVNHVPRVCVVGPEGGRKTALAEGLAEHFGTVCVPEYASIYIAEKNAVGAKSWWPEEFAHIANTQARLEEVAEEGARDLLVCDTDAFSVWVWHRDFVRHPSRAVRRTAEQRPADLYVLIDSSAVAPNASPQPVGGGNLGSKAYRKELKRSGRRFVEVSGSADSCVAQAAEAVEALLTS